ncbi:hypothetical protein ElyMa_003890600 [Elysia marginata]|uniref:Uncharacterized protein n=1 Tax=Elysia marginata TaxID=1093978 RepID=A0AAV4FQ44_9GAST|nr:hypothetical protein ElyMa_003890600 [Elysia marginata]
MNEIHSFSSQKCPRRLNLSNEKGVSFVRDKSCFSRDLSAQKTTRLTAEGLRAESAPSPYPGLLMRAGSIARHVHMGCTSTMLDPPLGSAHVLRNAKGGLLDRRKHSQGH